MPEYGLTLADRLAAGPIRAKDAASIIAGILDSVVTAHESGCILRDLSPTNVLLSDGQVRVRDSGVHRMAQDLSAFDRTLGAFAYLAPEQVRGSSNVDGRADIYAAGAIAFRLLSGRLPFEGPNALVLIAQKLERPPPTLESVTGRSFDALHELFVATALARDRNERYPTASVAREAWRLACTIAVAE